MNYIFMYSNLFQILASSAKNLIIIDFGMAIAFPTIVIPVLRGLQADRNPEEFLFLSDEQVSWYGKLNHVKQHLLLNRLLIVDA